MACVRIRRFKEMFVLGLGCYFVRVMVEGIGYVIIQEDFQLGHVGEGGKVGGYEWDELDHVPTLKMMV
jgi:hypothetical protein